MTNPTPPSPAALAVWEAFNEDEAGVLVDYGDKLAAALRVAADQVVPVPIDAKTSEEHWALLGVKNRLLAIADELEGAS